MWAKTCQILKYFAQWSQNNGWKIWDFWLSKRYLTDEFLIFSSVLHNYYLPKTMALENEWENESLHYENWVQKIVDHIGVCA